MTWVNNIFLHRKSVDVLVILLLIANLGCASKGLIQEKYEEEFYKLPKQMHIGFHDRNPTFIVYGDNQAGWRAYEKFVRKKNWATWKMAIIPFYQLYLLGNGIVGGVNWLRHTPDYGEKERLMMRDAIYAEAKRSNVDFILNVGDMAAHDGRRPGHWAVFLKEYREEHTILHEFPYLPVMGNHDRCNDSIYGLPNYQAIFDYPRFYVMDFPDVALFITDSNFILDQKEEIEDNIQDQLFSKWFVSDEGAAEPAWLERELRARSDVFKIIAFHHPLLSFGRHKSDWLKPEYGRNLLEKRRKLLELLEEEGVQLVFSGHDHVYQHVVLDGGSGGSGGGSRIHFVVSSGGGAPIRDKPCEERLEECYRHYREQGLSCRLVGQAYEHHYCIVNVSSAHLNVETFVVRRYPEEPVRLIEKIHMEKANVLDLGGSP